MVIVVKEAPMPSKQFRRVERAGYGRGLFGLLCTWRIPLFLIASNGLDKHKQLTGQDLTYYFPLLLRALACPVSQGRHAAYHASELLEGRTLRWKAKCPDFF